LWAQEADRDNIGGANYRGSLWCACSVCGCVGVWGPSEGVWEECYDGCAACMFLQGRYL